MRSVVRASGRGAASMEATGFLDPLKFFLLGLLCVLPFVAVTPPFQAPDEAQHYFRAYQLSELDVLSELRGGVAGAVLPSSLPELTESFLGTREIHIWTFSRPQPLQRTLAEFARPLRPERREFVNFTGSAVYSPLAYLPQAAAMAAGRLAGAGPLALLYIGRLANALAAVVVLSLAVAFMPAGWRPALLLSLLPMALFLYGSMSPDAAVISASALFTAIALSALATGRWETREVVIATICGIVFCSLKPTYAPLLLIGLPAVFTQSAPRVLLVHAVIVGVTVTVTGIWLYVTARVVAPAAAGTNFAGQVGVIVSDPLGYLVTVLRTLRWRTWFYYESGVALLGLLNVRLPLWAYAGPLLALALSVVGPRLPAPGLSRLAVAWFVVLLGASGLLVMTALYIYWTPVGARIVEGVHGRYFLPLLPLMAAPVYSLIPRPPRWGVRLPPSAAPAVFVLLALVAQVSLVRAYGLLGTGASG